VDAGRENDRDVGWRDAKLNQTPNQQIDNLRASRRAGGIRRDDQNGVAGID
jgi:hypothetical protein